MFLTRYLYNQNNNCYDPLHYSALSKGRFLHEKANKKNPFRLDSFEGFNQTL
jgi:hypothetical protein